MEKTLEALKSRHASHLKQLAEQHEHDVTMLKNSLRKEMHVSRFTLILHALIVNTCVCELVGNLYHCSYVLLVLFMCNLIKASDLNEILVLSMCTAGIHVNACGMLACVFHVSNTNVL